MQNNYMCN